MKKVIYSISMLILLSFLNVNAQVGIGTSNPDPSAGLDIDFSNKGILPPRLTTLERDQIQNPAEGLTIYNKVNKSLEFFDGDFWISAKDGSIKSSNMFTIDYVHCDGTPTIVQDVISASNGRIWMDRNLGASRVALNPTDDLSYGSLFQWGRYADGHQCRNSSTTTVIATNTDRPGHPDFIQWITGTSSNSDSWQDPLNTNLWQGLNGINNPCPIGYTVPTEAEFADEIAGWISPDASGSMASPLKIPLGGERDGDDDFRFIGTQAILWTQSLNTSGSSPEPRAVSFSNTFTANTNNYFNSWFFSAHSIRCIKNQP